MTSPRPAVCRVTVGVAVSRVAAVTGREKTSYDESAAAALALEVVATRRLRTSRSVWPPRLESWVVVPV